MVTAFYLSTGEGTPAQTEADFEFLGKDPRGMQTNFFERGVGGHEKWTHLNFDTSADTHTYTFDVSESAITWLVDGVAVRVERLSVPAMWVYLSLWDASQHPDWVGRVDWGQGPFEADFTCLEI
jgi:beta-glucanase (GH16 family)